MQNGEWVGNVRKGKTLVELGKGRYGREVERSERENRRITCRTHTRRQLKVRTDRTAVDRPGREKRFEVVYNRRSRKYGVRVRVKVGVSERERRPSRVGVYKAANWRERERWESYGIGVVGHPDRRRLLSDYGKEGFARRKDYPVSGFSEVRYDEGRKRVRSVPVERSQA